MKYSRPSHRISSEVFALLVLSVALIAGSAWAQQAPQALDRIVQASVDAKQFMGAVLVAKDGKIVLSKGYGSANLEWNIPDTPTTKFRLGSMTKQFTAAAILLLEERGKLKVEDPVKKYIADAPAAWDKVTIYNLLTHTSGIPSFTGFPEYHAMEATPMTPEKLVALFRDKPLEFQPGEKWNYSNSGYVLLGYLIEKISGQTYQNFVQQNFFTPLSMNDSGYDVNAAIIPRRAAGYTPSREGIHNAGYIDMTIPFSAGALYSTTEDLLKWEQGLLGGRVLQPTSLKKMTTPFKQDYGFGLFVEDVGGHKRIAHDGGIEGFNTSMAYYPDDKLTVIALSNLNGKGPTELAEKLAGAVLTGGVKEVTVPTDVLGQYVGSYELVPGFRIVVSVEEGRLMAQATNQQKFEIYQKSPDRYFYKVVVAEIQFHRDAAGAVTSMSLFQNGRELKGMKK
jgi:CubicO group peptidase (beta-lactamase class C family)